MNYGNKSNNRRVYQPKTSITNQIITEQEKLAAETALRSLKQKMANKEKKPLRQTNTANQGRRIQNYNNVNMKGNNYIHMSNTPNYNNNMKYNYPTNMTEINKTKGYYSNVKQNNMNKKPITANEYKNNHNYNANNNNVDLNEDDIYMNQNNYQKRNYNQNQYNMSNRNNNYKNANNNNNYYKNYSNNLSNNYSNNNNYTNNYEIGKPKRISNASAIPPKNNLNVNNYNNYNYNQEENENDDPRPIGGGLTADQVPNVSLPTTPCPHCGRSFNSNAFSKHIKICEKVFLKKRKAYNSQKHRFTESEQVSLMKQGALKEKMNPLLNKKKTGAIPKWKLQSMAFRAICNPGKNKPVNQAMMMNGNKNGMNNNMTNNKNRGGNKINNNHVIKSDNTGYENMGGAMNYAAAYGYKHCEFCNRNYNEDAYNKHLNFCKRRYENEQLKNKAKKSTNNNNSGIKSQYSKGIYGSVKYNNNVKYTKKK